MRHERVGAFEAEDVADRAIVPRRPREPDAGRAPAASLHLHELAALFHRAIPGELRLRHRPRLLRRVPARKRMLAASSSARSASPRTGRPRRAASPRTTPCRCRDPACRCGRARARGSPRWAASGRGSIRCAFMARSRWASTISIWLAFKAGSRLSGSADQAAVLRPRRAAGAPPPGRGSRRSSRARSTSPRSAARSC